MTLMRGRCRDVDEVTVGREEGPRGRTRSGAGVMWVCALMTKCMNLLANSIDFGLTLKVHTRLWPCCDWSRGESHPLDQSQQGNSRVFAFISLCKLD